ncbi:dynein regulatory complex protein 1 isoform X4 [Numida meleagris]|uniref:dynein regulatory complex protein 1 isoform X4 n=1 Tax=Numida meleagris TaxID=8996 RepID=UPI000B3DC44C|nr:dynein regulatory complex protein 1 isoform X4 [Numida meleagris]
MISLLSMSSPPGRVCPSGLTQPFQHCLGIPPLRRDPPPRPWAALRMSSNEGRREGAGHTCALVAWRRSAASSQAAATRMRCSLVAGRPRGASALAPCHCACAVGVFPGNAFWDEPRSGRGVGGAAVAGSGPGPGPGPWPTPGPRPDQAGSRGADRRSPPPHRRPHRRRAPVRSGPAIPRPVPPPDGRRAPRALLLSSLLPSPPGPCCFGPARAPQPEACQVRVCPFSDPHELRPVPRPNSAVLAASSQHQCSAFPQESTVRDDLLFPKRALGLMHAAPEQYPLTPNWYLPHIQGQHKLGGHLPGAGISSQSILCPTRAAGPGPQSRALGENEEPKEEAEEVEKERSSHKQVEESQQKLAKLLSEGTRMVTDIQVAADLREVQRRAEQAELKLQRVEKLENEARSSTCKFEEITSKWALAKKMTIPQELWQLLNQQQQQCTQLLEEKNKLIGELQQELKNKDEQYVQTIKKQSDDIHLLLERMEEQIRMMLKTYRHKIHQIEKAFELERRELLDNNRKKWEEAVQALNTKELEYLHARLRKLEEYEKQLNQLRVQDEEEYNSMKIHLESDVQNLERQLQHMKAVYLVNQEKLEYNLQVLKKQDEENTIIRSQQKRKLNRHFAASDAEKFMKVWLMNEEEAKGLMRKALDADRVIHTQQLGLPWEEPHYWFLNNVGPLRHYKAKRMAAKLAAEVLTESTCGGQEEKEKEKEEVGSGDGQEENAAKAGDTVTPLLNISKKTAKRILELVSDESGFLIERKLLRPLRALGKRECTLLRLDSIFSALEIDSEDDLYQLVDFFMKYKAKEGALSQSQGSPGGEDITDLGEDRADGESGAQSDELKSSQRPLGSLPSVYIHADDVLKILKAFVQDFHKLREEDSSAKEVLQVRDSSKDGEYWEALAHVIPEPTLKLWDALAVALEEYYNILTRRANLLAEAAALQQQNSELSLMLEQFITSGESAVSS